MSIFGKFKQALGFSDDENDDFYDGIDESPSALPAKREIQRDSTTKTEPKDTVATEQPTGVPTEIFERVVKLFNDSLPDFLKSCVDVDAQRKYIYESLDEGMKAYLDRVASEARQRSDGKWKEERNRLQTEMAQLKEQYKSIDEQRSEWQKQQLSAERQKRALSERLHDLEKQVATLEAEKEQYDLENKSLVNKLKVSAVVDGDMAEMRQEILNLQERLKEARESDKNVEMQALIDAANTTIAEKEAELAALKEKLSVAESQQSEQSAEDNSEEIDFLNKKIVELTSHNKTLEEAIEQLKTKEQIADEMINDLNTRASAAIQQLKEKESEFEVMSQQNGETDAQIQSLKDKLALANEELEASREELQEARESMQALDEIQEQIDKFEELKRKKDARITELQDESRKHLSYIAELESEVKSLKHTIDNNIHQHAEIVMNLRAEIDELKTQKADSQLSTPIVDLDEDETVAEIKATTEKKVKISAIDESLDDTDWLVATPPPGTITRPTPATTDEDFGYQSPTRKPVTPENDAQMSLF